jgi:hypothetical protein
MLGTKNLGFMLHDFELPIFFSARVPLTWLVEILI